jgi:hypothetical protein
MTASAPRSNDPPAAPAVDAALPLVVYGSLMSGLGMAGLGRVGVRAAARVRLANCRRGFGKKSQYGDRYAMVLEAERGNEPIRAAASEGGAPEAPGPEALLLEIPLADLARVALREGYRPEAVEALARAARAEGMALPDLLWSVAQAAEFDVRSYRIRLFERIHYTSPHYIPHPVLLSDGRTAIVFLPPGREGTGDPDVVGVRVASGVERILSLCEAWRLKPHSDQLDYFAMCLLGEVHGLSLADVLAGSADDDALSAALRRRIDPEVAGEVGRFLEAIGWSEERYREAFPDAGSRRR